MKTLGILGGGQLARMLALKAPPLGITPFVFSASADDPAAQVCPRWFQGKPEETSRLRAFLKKVEVLTFESELVPASLVRKALPKNHKLHIAPSLKILEKLQDRLSQKEMLQSYYLPSADFLSPSFSENTHENRKTLHELWDRFGPFVLKKREGGYDGYGTFPFRTKQQIKTFKAFTGSFIAEAFIPFKRELALLAVRNKKEIIFTPLVETYQKESRCFCLQGPVHHKGTTLLKKKISRFLNTVNYQGVIAFELFDTSRRLLVNELAPRVHNSGHYSLNALSEDQFTLHLKGIFNLPLSTLKSSKGFAMLNLIGEKESHWRAFKKFHFHWYGKTVSRKGRKMGHVNVVADTPKEALNKLLKEL